MHGEVDEIPKSCLNARRDISAAFHGGPFHESEPSSSRTLCKIVPQEQISESAVRRDLRVFVLIRED